MLLWIVKISIISIIFILIVHNILNFLKETLTIPKVKDLVNAPNEKYQDIYNIINKQSPVPISSNVFDTNEINGTTNISSIPSTISSENIIPKININDTNDMKNELKNFMKKQMNSTKQDPEVSQPQFMAL